MSVIADVDRQPNRQAPTNERRVSIPDSLLSNVGAALTISALIFSVATLIYALILALNWYNQPFFGAMVSRSLIVGDIYPVSGGEWVALEAGLKANDRILRVNGITLEDDPNPDQLFYSTIASLRRGDQVTVDVFRPGQFLVREPGCTTIVSTAASAGAYCSYQFRLSRMQLTDLAIQFGIAWATALTALILGTVVLYLRWRHAPARLLVGICTMGAVAVLGRFDNHTTYQLSLLTLIAACGLGGVAFELGLVFPYPLVSIRKQPWLRTLPLVFAVIVFLICLSMKLSGDSFIVARAELVALMWTFVGSATMLIGMTLRRRTAVSPLSREQAGLLLIGITCTLVPGLAWFIVLIITGRPPFSLAYLPPILIIFPFAFAYAILQRRVAETDRIITEGVMYTILGAMLVIGYLLVTGAAFALSQGVIRPDNPLVIAITLFFIAVGFTPLRLRMQQFVDSTFFRQRRLYERRIEQFGRSLTATVDLDEILSKVRTELDEALNAQFVFIFLRNAQTNEYEAAPDPATGKSATDVRFRQNSSLVTLLESESGVLSLSSGEAPPAKLFADRSRLALLNTPVVVRLRGSRRLTGFIAIGQRRTRADYTHEDLRYVEGVADQASAAFERAQMVIEARRNERELKVLSQVSAALNIAMDFDTLLEFIYTQVDKVIRAPMFYIVLRENNDLRYVFYQEQGERYSQYEGMRWTLSGDPISDVIRSQQPYRSDHIAQDIQRRDARIPGFNPNLRAWMCVPLSAGEGQVLGTLILSTTEPTVTYTEEQVRIFWNIADLAAAALFKTRLFSEMEERARQMKVLNDISSRLATEFEDLDALLQIIVESAVQILNCEAGSLLLVDESTSDLVFRLAVGGGGENLIGTRIPAGSGVAGQVVRTGHPQIVNEVRSDSNWYSDVDLSLNPGASGQPNPMEKRFRTQSILAVPLTARNTVIGVLEVINKRTGNSFDEAEVNLLTTFGNQAAVAIDNARLFRTTDEALAARVQQLDNMQRIDQELNRTLDFQRVIDLTIDNAIRESNSDAGALVLVESDPPVFRVGGSIGYPEGTLEAGQILSTEEGMFGRVYRSHQPLIVTGMEISMEKETTLPGSESRLAVPLVTGENISGVLLLESHAANAYSITLQKHIQGLAEHANTAITNARLFSRLEDANKARSQFVGFVAHELKNPLASIKGYSEVLLAGMTGNLSDQQQNFVATIRRNVVRIQQLVDDLRDLTAQETGNLRLSMTSVSINNVVVETLRPQQRAIDEKEQKVVLNVPESLPAIWGDELRLIQVMTNFVSNANKYTPIGGTITITAQVSENRWDPEGAPRVIVCSVADTGIGMDDEDLKKLFTAYWRSANPKAQEQSGTGLGMTLTRGLIEAHGGKVWVESTINVGTTFSFTVPLAEVAVRAR